uniref:Complexin-3-like n=1 Tax=Pogona vitticeps TaxID=103695 RepID=A0A6J0U1A7_9SAUR
MGSAAKSVFGVPANQLLCCVSANLSKEKDPSDRKTCLNRSPFLPPPSRQLSQKQKDKRDAGLARRKAERASMRAQLREKYQLPKNWKDKKQLQAAGVKPKLPPDLQAIVKPAAASDSGSIFPRWVALDFSSLRATAENAVQSLPGSVRQCPVM